MRHETQDWTFDRFDHRKHQALEEKRRRVGRRMWATVVALVVVPVALVVLVKGFM